MVLPAQGCREIARIAILAIFVLIAAGCKGMEYADDTTHHPADYGWSKVAYSGHVYIQKHGSHDYAILHDPDCPCGRAARP